MPSATRQFRGRITIIMEEGGFQSQAMLGFQSQGRVAGNTIPIAGFVGAPTLRRTFVLRRTCWGPDDLPTQAPQACNVQTDSSEFVGGPTKSRRIQLTLSMLRRVRGCSLWARRTPDELARDLELISPPPKKNSPNRVCLSRSTLVPHICCREPLANTLSICWQLPHNISPAYFTTPQCTTCLDSEFACGGSDSVFLFFACKI
jgi:hypothetical protein